MLGSNRTFYWFVEAWSPLLSGVVAFVLLLVFQKNIVAMFVDNQLSLSQMYTAIFGWASVMTGFQFGVYGLIFSKTDGFIAKINNTITMKRFMSYTSRAVILGFALTLSGFPFLVLNSEMKDISNFWYWCGSLYFALFVCSFTATIRVARLFASMARVRPKERLPA